MPDSPDGPTRRSLRAADQRRPAANARTDDGESSTGRHASRRGDRFTRVLTWTTVGTLIPGVGLIAAGRRLLGGIVLAVFIVALLAVAGIVLIGGPMDVGLHVAVSPSLLLGIAIACAVLLVVWAGVIIASYAALRRPLSLHAPQRVLGAILVVCLVAFAAMPTGLGAFYSLTERSLVNTVFGNHSGNVGRQAPDTTSTDPWENTPRINVLLLGSDAGTTRTGTRPDTLMVASIDTHTGQTKLIGVPRNLDFPIFPDGTKMAKRFPDGFDAYGEKQSMINAVWTWASEHPKHVDAPKETAGLTATTHAIEGSLGLQIDYFALVNLQGFQDLVDSIGGVDIDVHRKIPIGGGHNLNTGGKYPIKGWVERGEQHLDGYHALWYVRSREGSNNYDRMCRQQRMIKTVMGQVNPAKLALAFPQLAGSATRNVKTDIQQSELKAFVVLARKVQHAGFTTIQIDNNVVKTWDPNYSELHSFIKKKINQKPKPSDTAPTESKPSANTEKSKKTKQKEKSDPTMQCYYPPSERTTG